MAAVCAAELDRLRDEAVAAAALTDGYSGRSWLAGVGGRDGRRGLHTPLTCGRWPMLSPKAVS
eukprot:7104072-Prymnesium_polylepis.2